MIIVQIIVFALLAAMLCSFIIGVFDALGD